MKTCLHHSHNKRRDNLEIQIELLFFLLYFKISGLGVFVFFFSILILRRYKFLLYKFTNSTMNINSYTKQQKKLVLVTVFIVKVTFMLFYPFFVFITMVQTLLRGSLELKKIIPNAPCALQCSQPQYIDSRKGFLLGYFQRS